MLRSAALGAAIALVAAGGASAEVVARGVQDGLLALDGKANPSVAFVRGPSVYVSTRSASGRWVAAKAASVSPGSTVTAFDVGAAGPVVLVESADVRTLLLVRRRSVGWETIRLAGGLAARFRLGDWDGLLADVSLAEEILGDRRDSPPGFAPMHLAIAAFVQNTTSSRWVIASDFSAGRRALAVRSAISVVPRPHSPISVICWPKWVISRMPRQATPRHCRSTI